MKKLRILKGILKRTHTDRILVGYLLFILIDAFVVLIFEPNINKYGDALWYCYEVISTTGFGELNATTFIGRAASVLLTIYSLLIIAIVTGVVTNFYMEISQLKQKETVISFIDKLENLPDLSRDELCELSQRVKDFRNTTR